jgi:hypothetical protein
MKRTFAAGFILCLAGFASAQTFPASRLGELDKYLSNFAEAEFTASQSQLKSKFSDLLLDFASNHAIWNNKGKELPHPDWPLRSLTSAEVVAISERFFGRKPTGLQAALLGHDPQIEIERSFIQKFAGNGLLVIDGMEPQFSPSISRAFRVRASGKGIWSVDAVEYESSTGGAGKADYKVFRCMVYTLGPNSTDPKRWSMQEAKQVSRAEMEKKLGTKNFSIPRWKSS